MYHDQIFDCWVRRQSRGSQQKPVESATEHIQKLPVSTQPYSTTSDRKFGATYADMACVLTPGCCGAVWECQSRMQPCNAFNLRQAKQDDASMKWVIMHVTCLFTHAQASSCPGVLRLYVNV